MIDDRRFEEVIDEINTSRSNDPMAAYLKALAYEKSGKYLQALSALDGVSADPIPDVLILYRGMLHYKCENYRKAIQDFEYAHHISLYTDISVGMLFDSYVQKKEFKKAENTIEMLNTQPESTIKSAAMIRFYLATKNYKKSVEYFEQSVVNGTTNLELYNLGAQSYTELRDFKRADECAGMALDLNPGNAKANFFKAYSLLKLKRNKEACYYMNKAFELGYTDALHFLSECSD